MIEALGIWRAVLRSLVARLRRTPHPRRRVNRNDVTWRL